MSVWFKMTLAIALVLLAVNCGGDRGGEQLEEQAMSKAPLPPDLGNMTPRVAFETNKGNIVIELDREKAPKSAENILLHVENGYYDGLTFHRVIPGFMIQAGGFTSEMGQRQSPRPPVPNEANNGLKNMRGSVAMARTNDPHSATTQFFINLVDNSNLDFRSETPRGWGYAVVGRVVEGMDVVDAIAQLPTGTQGPHGDVPVQPVIITKAYVQGE